MVSGDLARIENKQQEKIIIQSYFKYILYNSRYIFESRLYYQVWLNNLLFSFPVFMICTDVSQKHKFFKDE